MAYDSGFSLVPRSPQQQQQNLYFDHRTSCNKMAGGKNMMIKKKFASIIIEAYIPKAFTGIIGLNALDKKATDVVLDVSEIALTALFQV